MLQILFTCRQKLQADSVFLQLCESQLWSVEDNGSSRERMQNSRSNASNSDSGNKYTPFPTKNKRPVRDVRHSTGSVRQEDLGATIHPDDSVPLQGGNRRTSGRGDGRVSQSSFNTAFPQLRSLPVSSLSASSSSSADQFLHVGSAGFINGFISTTVTRSRPNHALSAHEGNEPASCASSSSTPESSEVFLYLYKRLPKVSSDTDYDRLARSIRGLQEGCFYYTDLNANKARALLQNLPVGTYLVRDSSDPKFLFAISVKTPRGATSIRILYFRGFFQLDCDEQMRRKMPRFETVMDLLDFHTTVCKAKGGAQYRWQESSRRADMTVQLTTPRRHSPPTLAHMTRVTINKHIEDLHFPNRSTDLLPLPTATKSYLREYPYRV